MAQAVLITGCSSGIGRATAERLAGRGFAVYATARKVASIADLEARGCRVLALDVTDEDSMRGAVETVIAEHGAVHALVNNAGYSQSGAVESVPMADVRRQFETNVFGLVRMCQLVLPGMRAQGWGRIVNVSSMGGRLTFPGGGLYHGSKHAVEAISDALRYEVAGFGVHVVVVEPGLIRTRFGETAVEAIGPAADGPYAAFNGAVAQATAEAYGRGPLGRLGGSPDAVARRIEAILRSPRPRSRYPVTASARVMLTLRRLLPDAAWDAMLRNRFPPP